MSGTRRVQPLLKTSRRAWTVGNSVTLITGRVLTAKTDAETVSREEALLGLTCFSQASCILFLNMKVSGLSRVGSLLQLRACVQVWCTFHWSSQAVLPPAPALQTRAYEHKVNACKRSDVY